MPDPEKTPGESIAGSLGVENATPSEQVLIMAGLTRAAAKLLRERLSDAIPPQERAQFDEALTSDNLDEMIQILKSRFPDYDELQAAAIEEARQNVMRRAQAIKESLTDKKLPSEPEAV